jgi:hypothetical protein
MSLANPFMMTDCLRQENLSSVVNMLGIFFYATFSRIKRKSETADGQTKDLKISELLNAIIFKPPIKALRAQTVIVHIANQRFNKV